MTNRSMSFRIPDDLIQKIDHCAKLAGENRTTVVLKALEQVFNPPDSQTSAVHSILTQDLTQFETQLKAWGETLARLQRSNQLTYSQSQRVSLFKRAIDGLLALNQNAIDTPNTSDDSVLALPISLLLQTHDVAHAHDWDLAHTFSQILSAAADLLFLLDRTGRFTYLNPSGSWIFGVEPGRVLGKTWQELGISSDSATTLAARCQWVTRSGQPAQGEFHASIERKSKVYEYILSPIRNLNSHIDGVICIARDITQQKELEETLRETEEKYRNLFEAAIDSILIIDAETYCILKANWSALRQLGYTRREITHLTLHDIEAPMESEMREALLRQLDMNGSISFKHCYLRKDGSEIPVQINSRLVEYDNRLAIQSFARDMTALKEAEDKIQMLCSKLSL